MNTNRESLNKLKRKFVSFVYRTKWRIKHVMNKKKDESSNDAAVDHSMDNSILPSSIFTKKKRKQPSIIISILIMTFRLFVLLFIVIGIAGFGAFLGIGKAYVDGTPTLDFAEIEIQSETSFIYDKNGKLITEYYGKENRQWVSFEEIPDIVVDAFVAIEDSRFWVHDGLDYKRILGAVVNNATTDSVQGGSTITQQLIKNTILTPEQSYKRKIQEMYLALQLEKEYEKKDILEAYLNNIFLGGSNYGIKSAAKDYFGKELDELTITEAAMLAGITRNPWGYNPRTNIYDKDNFEKTANRTNLVLKEMYENNIISLSVYEDAKLDPKKYDSSKVYIRQQPTTNDYSMKYFIEYAIEEVTNALVETEGCTLEEADKRIYEGGLHIYTTLDVDMQQNTEQQVYDYKNLPKFKIGTDIVSKDGIEQPQAAVVVIDNQTGELRAIVGGKQPPTGKKQWNRAYRSKLATGSSIKPLSVYGPFIELGYPGGLIIEDVPASVKGWIKDGKEGYPSNYTKTSFSGPMDAREGIRKSINIVAARIVAERVGLEYSREKLIELGLNPSDVPTDSLSALSLGTGFNMIEVAGAYSTIAHHGTYREPRSFTKVVDKKGNALLSNESPTTRQVFSEETCYILIDWMKGVVNGGTTTVRVKNADGKTIPVAGKTGTNENFKGVYFAGFTPYYTTTVWIGSDDYNAAFKSGSVGGDYAAPLWEQIMTPIHEELTPIEFYEEKPEKIVTAKICSVSGKLATDACYADVNGHTPITEMFISKDAVPTETCTMHQPATVCLATNKLASPFCKNVVSKSIVVVPPDSPYALLSDEDLQKYLPGAMRGFADPNATEDGPIIPIIPDYYNPAHAGLFCHVHNENTPDEVLPNQQLAYDSVALTDRVEADMNNILYIPHLSADERALLQQQVNQLRYDVGYDFLTNPTNPYVAPFNVNQAQASYDALATSYNQIFTRIKQEAQAN